MRMSGRISYDPALFIVSVVIAVIAATAALWAALRLDGVGPTLGASVIMGVAVSGMHYMGMAAMRMYPANGPSGMVMGGSSGATAESFLLPLIIGIAVVTFVMTATITLSPTADEIRYDEALLRHIRGVQDQGGGEGLGPVPAAPPAAAPAVGLAGAPVAQDEDYRGHPDARIIDGRGRLAPGGSPGIQGMTQDDQGRGGYPGYRGPTEPRR
jgi:Bacterial signalling protein N terminal repeat